MKFLSLLSTLAAFLLHASIITAQGGSEDPVMAGYDVVAYHSLRPEADGIPGSPEYQHRHNGYLYYFATQDNLDAFVQNPEPYLPAYGGFCAWGVAWEYEADGWPWAQDHMGPPCGPRDGWALLTDETDGSTRLYCSIWRSYQDDFNRNQEEGIRLANQRWVEWYGSLTAGPKNNGCYAWNWQTCFAESIYDPSNPLFVDNVNDNNNDPIVDNDNDNDVNPTASPTMAPTQTQTQAQTLFGPDQTVVLGWSDELSVLGGALTFKWTLQNVSSIRPLLIVELLYEVDEEFDGSLDTNNQYVGFGVAEQVMQGALVICSPQAERASAVARSGQLESVTSTCKTYLGSGMGIEEPATDPVQPTVLESERNQTHYRVRFSANLFACWSNPAWPARVLFSRGLVSGNGDPMPHLNNPLHRQAVTGVEFLSVVENNDGSGVTTSTTDGPPEALVLEPLPNYMTAEVYGTSDSVEILDGRVTVEYALFHYSEQKEEVVHIHLNNVPYDPQEDEETYIGFGFATNTMSGLVITCSPSAEFQAASDGGSVVLQELTATCHQWRGLGTNLYPRSLETDAGGWFLTSLEGNGTHVNYTLAGRVADVLEEEEIVAGRIVSSTNLRAIVAIGRTAPDTGTPLMHTSRDRTPMYLGNLAVAAQNSVAQLKSSEDTSSTASASTSGAAPAFQALSLTITFAGVALLSAMTIY